MRKPLINPGIIKRLKSFFAIIQDTDTATRYIPTGKYVLYKNIACHASQNIESGDTLALGTNLVTDSDGFINCLNDGFKTKVSTSDIVNVLTSTDSTKPLSAAQGKALNDTLTTLNSKLNSNANATTDILADAVSVNGTKFFNGSGSDYTGDVPNTNFKYGIFTVMQRGNLKFVFAHSPDNKTAVNYYNGSSWLGWQQTVSSSKAGNAVFAVYIPSVTFTNGIATISVTKETFGYEKIRCPIAMISSSAVTSYSVNSCDMVNSNTTLRICLNDTSINATLNIFVHYSAY